MKPFDGYELHLCNYKFWLSFVILETSLKNQETKPITQQNNTSNVYISQTYLSTSVGQVFRMSKHLVTLQPTTLRYFNEIYCVKTKIVQ